MSLDTRGGTPSILLFIVQSLCVCTMVSFNLYFHNVRRNSSAANREKPVAPSPKNYIT